MGIRMRQEQERKAVNKITQRSRPKLPDIETPPATFEPEEEEVDPMNEEDHIDSRPPTTLGIDLDVIQERARKAGTVLETEDGFRLFVTRHFKWKRKRGETEKPRALVVLEWLKEKVEAFKGSREELLKELADLEGKGPTEGGARQDLNLYYILAFGKKIPLSYFTPTGRRGGVNRG